MHQQSGVRWFKCVAAANAGRMRLDAHHCEELGVATRQQPTHSWHLLTLLSIERLHECSVSS